MKTNIFLFIFFIISSLYFNNIFADTTLNWSINSWQTECPSEPWSDTWAWPRTMSWVPSVNQKPALTDWSLTCNTHYYYTSWDYTKTFAYNNWQINWCNSWDMVVKSLSSCNAATCTITCRKYDDITPANTDITWTNPTNWTKLMALDSRNFTVNVSSWWQAPITSVKVFFEDWNTTDWFLSTSKEYYNTNWTQKSVSENIKNVNNQIWSDWWRNYSLRVAKICDEAGNCIWTDSFTSNLKTFNYSIYANTDSAYFTTHNSSNQLWAINSNVADGSSKNLIITLKDIYWNYIIPASWISRTIYYTFNVTNNLYLNQFTRSWLSSVFMTSANWSDYTNKLSLWNNINNILWNQQSNNWDYVYDFKVYTPTNNQTIWKKSDPNANLILNSAVVDINWTIWSRTDVNIDNFNTTAQFNPLYTTNIAWDLTEWFIEWIIQDSNISIWTYWSTTWVSWWWLIKKTFWWDDAAKFKFYADTNSPPWVLSKTDNVLSDFNNINLTPLYTKLLQNTWSSISSTNKTYFSTHLSYTIDWKNVLYNSDIIWKDSYFWTENLTTFQKWIKTTWIVWLNTSKYMDIVSGQWLQDYSLIWNNQSSQWILQINQKNINKYDIIEAAHNFIKNTDNKWTHATYSISALDWTSWKDILLWSSGSVIYYKTNNLVKIEKTSTNKIWVNWKRTVIIKWANLYINSNLYYANNRSNLWIIVLKDESWNWGNVLIDNDLTNIVWTIFAQWSVFSSSNWVDILSSNSSLWLLKNQLHIYWSIFSENTIWGSRLATPACPYFVSKSDCDLNKAQQYDLNYLRRYFVWLSWLPYNWWKVSWWWTCTSPVVAWNCSWLDSDLSKIRLITTSNINLEPYAAYPVIIEYNPASQNNPAPIFDRIGK